MNILQESIPKLRFPEFVNEWSISLLKEITSYVDYRGRAPKKSESGRFLVTAKNIKQGFIDYECSKEYVDENDYLNVMSKGLPKIGDVLFTTEAPMGNVAQIDNPNIALAQRVIKFRGRESLNNSFLLRYMLSKPFKKYTSKKANGSTVKGISGKELHKTPIYFPDLQEQQKIASFLTAVEKKIEQLQNKTTLLQDYKKGVMQQIFSQALRFKPDNNTMVAERSRSYPDWEEKKLGEICDCLDNLRKPLNGEERNKIKGEYPYWGANNIMDYINDFIFDETVVLLAEDGGNFNDFQKRPIANISYGKCWVNNHTHVLRGKENILINEYLFYSLVHKNITAFVSGGTRSKLIKSEMLKIKIKLPSFKEQTKIANFLSAIDTKIKLVNTQLENTQQFKKGLLQQMFV